MKLLYWRSTKSPFPEKEFICINTNGHAGGVNINIDRILESKEIDNNIFPKLAGRTTVLGLRLIRPLGWFKPGRANTNKEDLF